MRRNDIFTGFGVEISLEKRSDFLVVKETLTRMGIPDVKNKILCQSCHILHKQGRYVIIHFRELYALDGRHVLIEDDDIARRNKIVALLAEWKLIKILEPELIEDQIPITQLKVLSFKEKNEWGLEARYKFLEKKKDSHIF
jgi:Bacteriophage translational regulator